MEGPARSILPGALLLAVAAVASASLVLQELVDLPLPGCGPESACARASASVWGRLPLVGWPVADLGLAWFLALLVAWVRSGGRLQGPWRLATRVGAVASIGWVVAMLHGGYLCPWCLTVHAANLVFLVLVERAAGRPVGAGASRGSRSLATPAVTTFVVVTGLLAVLEWRQAHRVEQRDQAEYEQSMAALGAGGGSSGAVPLTGRHRKGPEVAPLRLVIFSDYQCPDCRALDEELEQLMASRDDLSVSVRHFPQCVDCNRRFRESGNNRHKNACWAARAAETAGSLHGVAGFWAMHRWLFVRRGAFDDRQLDAGLAELGFDRGPFLRLMQGPATLATVEGDVEEALALGIRSTPMVFLNGVEFRGWQAEGALTRAVETLAATSPPARGPDADRPPRGLDRTVADWRAEPQQAMPPDLVEWSLPGGTPAADPGPAAEAPAGDGLVTVTLFGDYREPSTPELDRRMRAAVADRPDTRYVFRHYPFDSGCNPHYRKVAFGGSCLSARAAEAAGVIGGTEGFWAMHTWLMDRPTGKGTSAPSEALLVEAARALGLDGDAMADALRSTATDAAILDDCEAGRALRLPSVPALYLDGRRVPRWKEGDGVPEHLLDLARSGG